MLKTLQKSKDFLPLLLLKSKAKEKKQRFSVIQGHKKLCYTISKLFREINCKLNCAAQIHVFFREIKSKSYYTAQFHEFFS